MYLIIESGTPSKMLKKNQNLIILIIFTLKPALMVTFVPLRIASIPRYLVQVGSTIGTRSVPIYRIRHPMQDIKQKNNLFYFIFVIVL